MRCTITDTPKRRSGLQSHYPNTNKAAVWDNRHAVVLYHGPGGLNSAARESRTNCVTVKARINTASVCTSTLAARYLISAQRKNRNIEGYRQACPHLEPQRKPRPASSLPLEN